MPSPKSTRRDVPLEVSAWIHNQYKSWKHYKYEATQMLMTASEVQCLLK